MRIPSKFLQFENEKVLMVAGGAQEADIYIASNGTLDKVVSFRIPRRKYSDVEGFFAGRTKTGKKGRLLGTGAAREYPKEASIKEFLNRLESEIKIISKKEKISYVCLFSPDYMMKAVKSVFPAILRSKIKILINGNFAGHSADDLLKKISLKIKKII